jgi:hypothetical protein
MKDRALVAVIVTERRNYEGRKITIERTNNDYE